MDERQLADEVQRCIARCGKSKAPMVCIAEYALILQDVHGWDSKDADEVGRRAVRALKAVDAPPEAP